jgi:hypothetical protein
MSITIKTVETKKDLKTFIYLPEKIHAEHSTWAPPIYPDEWKYFNPKKNRAYSYSDTILLLAYRGDHPVGRIMGIINHRYNEQRREKTARFAYFETYEDAAVFNALLDYIEDWARKKGMARIIGPYGFSDQDPEAWQIEGFENSATIATYHNFAFMPKMVEARGYAKDIDYFVYKVPMPKQIPELYLKVTERILKKGSFRVLEFKKRKEIKPWIRPVLGLMNECYTASNIYGYAPLDDTEMDDLAKRYLPVMDPRFVKVVLKDKEVCSFIIGMPDLIPGIRKAKGQLFPFGFIKILSEVKKTKQLDLLLGAIKEKYRGLGLDGLMGARMLASAMEAGFEFMDTHHEMEANVRVRTEMERAGGQVYKKFRVFQKTL